MCFNGLWVLAINKTPRLASPRKAAVLVTGFKCFALLATTNHHGIDDCDYILIDFLTFA
jgi:hypothetical protein